MVENLGKAGRVYSLTEKGRNAFGYTDKFNKLGLITWENDEPKLHLSIMMKLLTDGDNFHEFLGELSDIISEHEISGSLNTKQAFEKVIELYSKFVEPTS